jgi:hypothetical protein
MLLLTTFQIILISNTPQIIKIYARVLKENDENFKTSSRKKKRKSEININRQKFEEFLPESLTCFSDFFISKYSR